MYLLRSQLDVDATFVNGLRRFCNFVSIFYAPYWLQCPLASKAAVNDLEFHRAMMNYSSVDEEVAEAARHTFLKHRWYLTAEFLALCSQQLPDIEHEKLAFSIYKSYQKHVSCVQNPTAHLISEKPQFPNLSLDTCVSDIVGERSVIIFQRLNLSLQDIRFLTYSRDKWCDFDEYKKFKMLINDLKVVNDVAERGVRLMEEFKDVLTDDEEERRMLLHCVEDTRKLYPDFRKSTLAKTH